MTSLYEIARVYHDQALALQDLDLPPEVIADTLESLSGDLTVKAENVIAMARNMEALAASIKEAEAAMSARRKALENRAARLRDYLLSQLQVAGIQKVESPYFRISVRENPAAVEVFDALQVPAAFMRQPEPPPAAPDKASIKAALSAGQDVPGCKLTRGVRLEVR